MFVEKGRSIVAAVGVLALGVAGVFVAAPAGFAATAPAYTVIGPTQKVLRDTASVTGTTGAQLMGAGNEFVSFQIVLPGAQSGVSVATGAALTGAAGTIPDDGITIYREDYYTSTQASSAGRTVGAWPDALIPVKDRLHGEARTAFPIDVPAGQNRVAFVDIHIPDQQAAGAYDGSVTVTDAAGGAATVPVHLDVRAFSLPSTSSLRSLYAANWRTPYDSLYPGTDPFASLANEQRAWQADSDLARLALDDRITIGNPDFQPPTTAAEKSNFTQFTRPLIDGTADTQLTGAKLTAVAVDMNQLPTWKQLATDDGFADRAVGYDNTDCDEPTDAKYANCITVVNRDDRPVWPALPNLMTTTIQRANKDDPNFSVTDILVPLVDYMDATGDPVNGNQSAAYDAFRATAGKQLWMYTSCDVDGCSVGNETDPKFDHPWLDYTIDTLGGQNRAMGWLDYLYGATGELYYSTTQSMTTAWNTGGQFVAGGNGDGNLFYPGTVDRIGGSTPIPLESLRLKEIRDGYQDYEYLKLAANAGHQADALAVAKSVYPATYDTDATDAQIDAGRARLADDIAPEPALTYTAQAPGGTVVQDGQLGEYANLPAITLNGTNNTAVYRLGWDAKNLYLAADVTDAVLRTNESGRDGEVWDGDAVELMLSRAAQPGANPSADDYHVLVNVDGAMTDERGNGTGWDRSWTSNAGTSVVRTDHGYTVEVSLPWSSLGGPPADGGAMRLDVANDDSDTAGAATAVDWAGLTRFAQPNAWGTLSFG